LVSQVDVHAGSGYLQINLATGHIVVKGKMSKSSGSETRARGMRKRAEPHGRRERAYHHGAVREMLLAEAFALAADGGVGAVNLREAARRIGISHSAAYHHFGDKSGIIVAAATEGMRRLARELEKAENEEAADPTERICRIAAAYVGFAIRDAAAFRLIFAPEVAHKSNYPELRGASDEAAAPLLRALAAWRDSPELVDEEELRELAVSLWSLVHGLSDLALNAQLDEGELRAPSPRHEETYRGIAWRAAARHLSGARS
jgi:AcrR family transcriptional regulator